MSDITIEKKLELMRQIRSRSEQDRFDMSKREQLLYGKSMKTMPLMPTEDCEEETELQTFPLRILLSVALFLLIVISDLSGKSFLGINATRCFESIAIDYESSISAWVDAASEETVEVLEENPPTGSRP